MLTIEHVPPRSLQPRLTQLRKRHPKQLAFLKCSIETNGFLEPVLKKNGRVVHGELRVAAAIEAGLNAIPAIELDHLSQEQARAYAVSTNQIGALAGFDEAALAVELGELASFAIDLNTLGFEPGELDRLLGHTNLSNDGGDDVIPPVGSGPAIAQVGDLFLLDKHRLLCGDALASVSYEALLAGELAELILSDPPFNDKVSDISGKGRIKHPEFVQASGEMTDAEFTRFLTSVMRLLRLNSVDGSLHYLFMCGRQLLALLRAGNVVYDELKAIVTWDKLVPGMGSLYRGQTEFVGVFKWGKQHHVNNVMLGVHGRNRSNLWRVENGSNFSAERQELLKLHPTVKPLSLIGDAILDASSPGGLVLDPFVGSGTIFLAAQKTGRRAAGIELDRRYVDVALRRFRTVTGIEPIHADTGRTFAEMESAAIAIPDGPEEFSK